MILAVVWILLASESCAWRARISSELPINHRWRKASDIGRGVERYDRQYRPRMSVHIQDIRQDRSSYLRRLLPAVMETSLAVGDEMPMRNQDINRATAISRKYWLRVVVQDAMYSCGEHTAMRAKLLDGTRKGKSTILLQGLNEMAIEAQVGDKLDIRGRMVPWSCRDYGERFVVESFYRRSEMPNVRPERSSNRRCLLPAVMGTSLAVEEEIPIMRQDMNQAGAASSKHRLRVVVHDAMCSCGKHTAMRAKLLDGTRKGKSTILLQDLNEMPIEAQVGDKLDIRGQMVPWSCLDYREKFVVESFDRLALATLPGVQVQSKEDRGQTLLAPSIQSKEALHKLLTSLKGVGPKMAEAMITKFGNRAIEMIKSGDEELLELPRMGTKTLEKISKSANEHFAEKNTKDVLSTQSSVEEIMPRRDCQPAVDVMKTDSFSRDKGRYSSDEQTSEKEYNSLNVAVKEIIFSRGTYTVLKAKLPKRPRGRKSSIVLTASNGALLGTQIGEELEVRGQMVQHETYGEQFVVEFLDRVVPTTESDEGPFMLLTSGVIKGVGPKMAEALIRKFGNRTIEMIRSADEALLSVPRMGRKTLEKISKSANEYFAKAGGHDVLNFAVGLGLTIKQASVLLDTYKGDMQSKLEENVYGVMPVLPELRFNQVDHIAHTKLNFSADSFHRASAAIVYVLKGIANDGHCYMDRHQLLLAARRLLKGDGRLSSTEALRVAEQALSRMRNNGLVHIEIKPEEMQGSQQNAELSTEQELSVFLPSVWQKEVAVACAVRSRSPAVHTSDNSAEPTTTSLTINEKLSAAQQQAVVTCSEMRAEMSANETESKGRRLLILTGGPGTGKTFTVREIVRSWLAQGRNVLLASPTARAAKVLEQTVGLPASTMHRMLEYDPIKGVFQRNRQNPLVADAVVIDEASMLDIDIAALFLEALPPSCLILFVGDANQLPSVGPGAVLHDMLKSPRIKRVELNKIFRTDPLGDIARNSALINEGSFPKYLQHIAPDQLMRMHEQRPGGCVFVSASDASEAQDIISEKVLPWLRSVGYDLIRDVQVLSPQKKGLAGTYDLNQVLRPLINPKARERASQGKLDSEMEETVSIGDHMIQLKNDYDSNVFNGDMGVVVDVMSSGRNLKFSVRFDTQDKPIVNYTRSTLGKTITLAYALTVHKSQGSQYEVVCMPVLHEHAFMLERNLLYTGISRAKRLLVLVGSEDAIAKAIKNKKSGARRTMLQQRISNDHFATKVTPWLWLNAEE